MVISHTDYVSENFSEIIVAFTLNKLETESY